MARKLTDEKIANLAAVTDEEWTTRIAREARNGKRYRSVDVLADCTAQRVMGATNDDIHGFHAHADHPVVLLHQRVRALVWECCRWTTHRNGPRERQWYSLVVR